MSEQVTEPAPEGLPVCSVCIANYNGAKMLRDCVDSILAQNISGEIEIIVHDDASNDDSVALVRDAYPTVNLIISAENVGFCKANNRMVAQSRGRYVLLLNNDATLLEGAVSTFIGSYDSQRLQILTLPQYDWETGELVDRGCLLDPFYNPVPNLDPARTDVAMAIGACMFLPRSLWDELGGFPEWMESIAEDLYICCLARLRGARVCALAQSGYRHRRGASFSGERDNADKLVSTFRRRRLSERNKMAALFVCTPTPLMWPLLALHLTVFCCEGAILTCVKRDSAIWREIYATAVRDLWLRREWFLRLRHDTQAKRRIGLFHYLRVFRPFPYKLIMLLRHGLPKIRR